MAKKAKKVSIEGKLADSKEILFDLFKRNKIKKVEVYFNGSGDDGQIDQVAVDDKDDHPILKEKLVGAVAENGRTWNGTSFEPIYREAKDVCDVITSVCYEVLESVASGWENGEGAEGAFVWDVEKRTIELDFGERHVEIKSFYYRV